MCLVSQLLEHVLEPLCECKVGVSWCNGARCPPSRLPWHATCHPVTANYLTCIRSTTIFLGRSTTINKKQNLLMFLNHSRLGKYKRVPMNIKPSYFKYKRVPMNIKPSYFKYKRVPMNIKPSYFKYKRVPMNIKPSYFKYKRVPMNSKPSYFKYKRVPMNIKPSYFKYKRVPMNSKPSYFGGAHLPRTAHLGKYPCECTFVHSHQRRDISRYTGPNTLFSRHFKVLSKRNFSPSDLPCWGEAFWWERDRGTVGQPCQTFVGRVVRGVLTFTRSPLKVIDEAHCYLIYI